MKNRNRLNTLMEKWLNFGKFPGSELGERETGFRHRNYYHKHFMGYTEVRRVNSKGRVISERHYTAPWQRHCLTDRQWVLTKAAYVLGVLISTALFLWALIQRVPSNSAAIAAAPGFISVLFLVLLWMAVFAYVSAPRKMTLWEYRSGKSKIELFTRLFAAGAIVTTVAKIVFICAWMDFSWEGEIAGLVVLLLSAVPPVLIFLAERKMKYEELENKALVNEEERYDIQ